MKTILCFGNEFLKQDALAKQIIKGIKIKGIKFIKCDAPEEIFDYNNPIIMDVAKGIKKVELIDNINQLKLNKIYSMHDFDLAYYLKLMKALKKLKKVRIIALPIKGNKAEIKKQLITFLCQI